MRTMAALLLGSSLVAGDAQELLFAFFDGSEANGLYLALRDGSGTWTRLRGGQPIIAPRVGDWQIFRDPHLSQGPDGRWRVVWTTGSTSYGFIESADLISFSSARAIAVTSGANGPFKYTWAPEITWDPDAGNYLVHWTATLASSPIDWTAGGDHRIYAHRTTDFAAFTPVQKIYDPGFTVIDSNLIKVGSTWHLFIKDERQSLNRAIYKLSGPSSVGPWSGTSALLTPNLTEGPTVIANPGGGYTLFFDYFSRGGVYGSRDSADLATWTPAADLPTGFPARHGNLMWISSTQAASLRRAWAGTGNTAPEISPIAAISTPVGTAAGPIAFTVGDTQTAPGALTVSRTTGNAALLPLSGIVLGGSGAYRTLTVTPAPGQSGTTTITISASDGTLVGTRTVTVTVGATAQIPGDVTADGVVDAADLALVSGQFGRTATDAGFDSRADADADTRVTISDLSIVTGNYGRTAP